VVFQGTVAAGLTQYRAYSTDEVMSYLLGMVNLLGFQAKMVGIFILEYLLLL